MRNTTIQMYVCSLKKYILSQGLGTDEDTLIEILVTRTKQQIEQVKKAYSKGTGSMDKLNQLYFIGVISIVNVFILTILITTILIKIQITIHKVLPYIKTVK